MIVAQSKSLKGTIGVPGDSSISHRAVIFSSLSKGVAEISGLSMKEDCLSTIDCFRKMGVAIEILPEENRVRVNGKGLYGLRAPTAVLNAGKSGTTIRLLLGVLSGQPFASQVIRDESVIKKPVGKPVRMLRCMGANITGRDDGNYSPFVVSPARLTGMTCELAPEDAHIKSPLLIAGLYAEGRTTVLEQARSRDHSELMLRYLGAKVEINDGSVTCEKPGNLYARDLSIPGDITMASYYITASLLVPDSRVTIANSGINPTRTGIISVYRSMGANIGIINEHEQGNEMVGDIVVETSDLKGTIIEERQIPFIIDEIPAIIVAASLAEGVTQIRGIWQCKIKETVRIKSVIAELLKMGANIKVTENDVEITGVRSLRGTIVECGNDHLAAMALAVAGLAASGETMIRKAQILDAEYPEFITVLNKLNAWN